MNDKNPHIPVLLNEVLSAINPQDGALYIDGTFGAGGYSDAVLAAANCRVIAIDRDPSVREYAQKLTEKYGDRFRLKEGCFGQMSDLLKEEIGKAQGVMLDIGVSSMQIDAPERGFSFRNDGPLDMRMSQAGISAHEIVNQSEEAELADIFYLYGEERASRRVAHAIVDARQTAPIETTAQLAAIIRRAVKSAGKGNDDKDPATRSFQGLRIYVNQELDELKSALAASEKMLAPGGILAVVTFHSLEDRIVKRFLQEKSGSTPNASRHIPQDLASLNQKSAAHFKLLKAGAITASKEEITSNPRSRSAKLRIAQRTNIGYAA